MFCKKNIKYNKENVIYYKTKNGKETYSYVKNQPIFIKDVLGNQIYARDAKKNQIYPSKGYPFAKNKFGKFYYATDENSDEFYPKRGSNLMIRENGAVLIAHFKSMRQRYPIDRFGNNYFPIDANNKPFYLLDEYKNMYYPKTKRNYLMSLEKSLSDGTICFNKKRDYLNNIYYTNDGNDRLRFLSELIFCCSTIFAGIIVIFTM